MAEQVYEIEGYLVTNDELQDVVENVGHYISDNVMILL